MSSLGTFLQCVRLNLHSNYPQETHQAQHSFSSEKTPTVWKMIPILEALQENWEIMRQMPKFEKVEHSITKGLEKLQKWYVATDQSDMSFICLGKQKLSILGNLHLLLI